MTTRFLSLFIFIVVRVAYAAERETTLFESVVHRGDVIVVTLSRSGARFAITDSPQPRVAAPGESFQLHDGESLSLSERHSSYRVTCRIAAAPAGLKVLATFDARSFGGAQSEKSYFIKAH